MFVLVKLQVFLLVILDILRAIHRLGRWRFYNYLYYFSLSLIFYFCVKYSVNKSCSFNFKKAYHFVKLPATATRSRPRLPLVLLRSHAADLAGDVGWVNSNKKLTTIQFRCDRQNWIVAHKFTDHFKYSLKTFYTYFIQTSESLPSSSGLWITDHWSMQPITMPMAAPAIISWPQSSCRRATIITPPSSRTVVVTISLPRINSGWRARTRSPFTRLVTVIYMCTLITSRPWIDCSSAGRRSRTRRPFFLTCWAARFLISFINLYYSK